MSCSLPSPVPVPARGLPPSLPQIPCRLTCNHSGRLGSFQGHKHLQINPKQRVCVINPSYFSTGSQPLPTMFACAANKPSLSLKLPFFLNLRRVTVPPCGQRGKSVLLRDRDRKAVRGLRDGDHSHEVGVGPWPFPLSLISQSG